MLNDRPVWLASFPKSGNTWVRMLLANLVRSGSEPADINAIGFGAGIVSTVGLEAATLLDSSDLTDDEVDRLRPMLMRWHAAQAAPAPVLKIHDAYTRLPDGTPVLGCSAAVVLYIVRDPRDIVGSLVGHFGFSVDVALRILNAPRSRLERDIRKGVLRQQLFGWSGHAGSWLEQTEIPLHLVRYEDMLDQPIPTLGRVATAVGLTADITSLRRAVTLSDFAILRAQEDQNGFRERGPGPDPFFRKGRAGTWRQLLTAEQAATIEETHGPMMRRLGYLPG